MGYKADLAERPGVVTFFTALRVGVELELARRGRSAEPIPAAMRLRERGRVQATDLPPDDRVLVREYLELLGANARLSPAVREACMSLVNTIDGSAPDEGMPSPA